MEVGTTSKFKRTLRHLSPAHIVRGVLTRRTVQKAVAKYGLVYFGKVDHSEEDAHIVRGHTVSPSQLDNHYSVGTIQGYDVTFVQRNSLTLMFDGTERRCHWLIASIKLMSPTALPHIYVGAMASDSIFKASYTQLKPLFVGNTTTYPQKFVSNFSVYGKPSDVITIERLIPPSAGIVIADYFGAMPFEIEDNTLYIYNENQHPTDDVIDTMFENGIWLAKTIDSIAGVQAE